MKRILTAALLLPCAALADLSDETPLVEGVIAAGMAYELAERCEAVELRRIAGIRYLLSLRGAARDLGYSGAQIEAWTDDEAEQDRLEGIARARLAALGAHGSAPQDAWCATAHAQIAAGTVTGRLLDD
ncbi:MAG: DUF5333 family protein [Paracoccaceae bacterium]